MPFQLGFIILLLLPYIIVMMQFKKWLKLEMGPGGNATMDDPNKDMMDREKAIAAKGAGAWPQGGDNPPIARRTAMAGYEGDPAYRKRAMRKKMKKS